MTEVQVRSIATGGEGVGRLPDGVAVFVPRTAPGDVVDIEVTERHQRWARGRLRRLIEAGPGRVPPMCGHYERDACGSCQLQHLTIEAQRSAKGTIVADVLRRVGKRSLDPPVVVAAPDPWGYRTKITLAVVAETGRIGYRRHDAPGSVFDLTDCPVAVPALVGLLARVRDARTRLPTACDQLVLRLDREGGLHLLVRGGSPPWDAAPLAAVIDVPGTTVWWQPAGGAVRAVEGRPAAFPVLAFQQTSPALADRIRHAAVAWLEPTAGAAVWDLYGGVGDAARLLAGRGAAAWSVDADRSAVAWAERQPADGGPIRYVAGRVEEVLHRLPEPAGVLLNPPRGGAHRHVTAAIDRAGRGGGLRRVAYISCDPATLARDLARLPAFRLHAVTAYDLFPQTAHVETLALLEAA